MLRKEAGKKQNFTNSLIYDMVAQFYGEKQQAAERDKLFNTEKHLIEKIAGEGNCVIVGRCADYICKNMENVYDIFLYADNEHKIREIMICFVYLIPKKLFLTIKNIG